MIHPNIKLLFNENKRWICNRQFDKLKEGNINYLNVSIDSNGIINPSQNRILRYPAKNAFLTGKVLIEKPDSVGTNSFASGYESKATGAYSQALGYQAIARGQYSTSIGYQSVTNGSSSYAFGSYAQTQANFSYSFGTNTITKGQGSVALGIYATASGNSSIAIVNSNTASGYSSLAMGLWTTAGSDNSTALGSNTKARGNNSTALGLYTFSNSYACIVIGLGNDTTNMNSINAWVPQEPLFIIGNGWLGSLSNAFTVLKNGSVGIGITSPGTKLAIAGLTGSATGSTLIINGNNVYYLTSKKESKKTLNHLLTILIKY